jgi:hypothetical protein
LTGLILAVGCNQPPKPMRFNNTMARANKRLAEAAKKFNKAIIPLKTSQPADLEAARGAYTEMQVALTEITKEYAAARPPVNSPLGREMLEKYRDFLKTEQEVFDACITPMWEAIQDDKKYPDAARKWEAVEPLLTKARDTEREAWMAVRKAQFDYCNHYKLEAKDK